jgi:hypothetical protein
MVVAVACSDVADRICAGIPLRLVTVARSCHTPGKPPIIPLLTVTLTMAAAAALRSRLLGHRVSE